MRKVVMGIFICFVFGLSGGEWQFYSPAAGGAWNDVTFRGVSPVGHPVAYAVGDSGQIWVIERNSVSYEGHITNIPGVTLSHWDFKDCAFRRKISGSAVEDTGFIVGERNSVDDGTDRTIHEGIIIRLYVNPLSGPSYSSDVQYSSDILGAPIPFYSVAVCRNNPHHAYIGAGRGIILETTDGGNTWVKTSPIPLSDSSDIFTHIWVDSSDYQQIWAVADNQGLITRSLDGGATWDIAYHFPRTYDIPDFAPFSGYYPTPAVSAMDIVHSIIPLAFKRVGRYENGLWYVDTLPTPDTSLWFYSASGAGKNQWIGGTNIICRYNWDSLSYKFEGWGAVPYYHLRVYDIDAIPYDGDSEIIAWAAGRFSFISGGYGYGAIGRRGLSISSSTPDTTTSSSPLPTPPTPDTITGLYGWYEDPWLHLEWDGPNDDPLFGGYWVCPEIIPPTGSVSAPLSRQLWTKAPIQRNWYEHYNPGIPQGSLIETWVLQMNRYGVCSNWVQMNMTAPLVNSDNFGALSGNNARVIAVHWPKISIVYRNKNKIYCITSPDTGKTWESPEYVGGGQYLGPPAADYAPNGDLYVLWVDGNGLRYAKKTSAGWSLPILIDMGNLLIKKWHPSMTIDDWGYMHFFLDGWSIIKPYDISIVRWVYGKLNTQLPNPNPQFSVVDSILYGEYPPLPHYSCNVAVREYDSLPQLAYDKDGEIWYARLDSTGMWERMNVSNSPDVWSSAPSMDIRGLNVNIVYEEETAPNSGEYTLISKTGFTSSTKSADFQADSFAVNTGNSSNPFVIANRYLFFEKASGTHRAIYRCNYDPLLFEWRDTVKISNIPWADARSPQATFFSNWYGGVFVYAWAEGKEPHIMVQEKDSTWGGGGRPYLPLLLSLNLGGITPSPFTVQRAGYIDYSSGTYPYEIVDYHPNELIYRIPGLNPDNKYKIKLAYYQKSGSKWKERLVIDQTPMGEKWVPSGEVIWVEKWIPDVDIQDGEIEVHIIKEKGDYAVCGVMYIYETPRGKGLGGPQFSDTKEILPAYSLSVYPNPLINKGFIKFSLPRNTKVNISLYDAIGRKVAVMVNGEEEMGYHSISLNPLRLSSGIYFVVMTGEKRLVKKLIVVK